MATGVLLSSSPTLAKHAATGTRSTSSCTTATPIRICRPQLPSRALQAMPLRQQCCRSSSVAATRASASHAAAASCADEPTPQASNLLSRAAALAVLIWRSAVAKLRAKLAAAAEASKDIDPEAVNAQIKTGMRDMRRLVLVAPFAAMSGSSVQTLLLLTRAVSSFIKLYLLLLFLRVLLSWFPAFNWEDQPWLALRQVTDPYLNLFRGLVPPLLGSIDFTPLFGFMILQFLAGVLEVQDDEAEVW